MPGAPDCGWFGKLPALGDFGSRRLPPPMLARCDAWLSTGLASSRARLGERWLELYLGAPLWRDGVLPWQPYVGEAVENDLISVTTDGIVSIRVALEDWTAGPEITPESIQQQLINNGTPPGFMAGDPPPITIAGAVPLGAAYDTPFVYMNTYYLELVGDQAVIVLISANNKAEADELVAWADGRIVRL